MCKKLTFLISLVALLGLVNVAPAEIVWIGAGSFCDPANWDGGVVPGPGQEAWIDCDQGGGDIVIDCDVEVGNLRGPAIEADCNQTMEIVSGNIVCESWRAAMEGSKTCIIDMCHGTFYSAGEVRWNDDAADVAYINIHCDFVFTCDNRVRSGDSGGMTHITITEDAVVNVAGYMRIGDDGGGSFTASGNAQVNVGEDLYFVGREMSVTVDVSGNCEIYVGSRFGLGNPGQLGGTAPPRLAPRILSLAGSREKASRGQAATLSSSEPTVLNWSRRLCSARGTPPGGLMSRRNRGRRTIGESINSTMTAPPPQAPAGALRPDARQYPAI